MILTLHDHMSVDLGLIDIRRSEDPFPLHSKLIRSTIVGSDLAFLSLVLSVLLARSFPLTL